MKIMLIALGPCLLFSPVSFATTTAEEGNIFFPSKPFSGPSLADMLEEIKRKTESDAYKEAQKAKDLYEKEFYANSYGADSTSRKGSHLY